MDSMDMDGMGSVDVDNNVGSMDMGSMDMDEGSDGAGPDACGSLCAEPSPHPPQVQHENEAHAGEAPGRRRVVPLRPAPHAPPSDTSLLRELRAASAQSFLHAAALHTQADLLRGLRARADAAGAERGAPLAPHADGSCVGDAPSGAPPTAPSSQVPLLRELRERCERLYCTGPPPHARAAADAPAERAAREQAELLRELRGRCAEVAPAGERSWDLLVDWALVHRACRAVYGLMLGGGTTLYAQRFGAAEPARGDAPVAASAGPAHVRLLVFEGVDDAERWGHHVESACVKQGGVHAPACMAGRAS